MPPIIAVVGATGAVGRQILNSLERHDVEPEQLRLFASERSEGEELDYQEETLPVEKLDAGAFRGCQAVILAVPAAVAPGLASRAQQEGAWVVDVSGSYRVDAAVPLVAPGVNDSVLTQASSGRVVCVAHPATQAMLAVLKPLREHFGLSFADATFLLGAASRGRAGQDELSQQTAALLNGKEPEVAAFPHRLGFNIIPAVGTFEAGLCELERHVLVEAARVWSGDALPAMTATALMVPTYHGLVAVLSAHLQRAADAEAVRAVLKQSPALKVLDEPSEQIYPMPMLTVDDASPHVGRVRAAGPRVQLVFAVDNVFRLADSAVDLALRLTAKT